MKGEKEASWLVGGDDEKEEVKSSIRSRALSRLAVQR
jgi:hypothetical protein